jgi:hypothetical protein
LSDFPAFSPGFPMKLDSFYLEGGGESDFIDPH